MYNALSVWNNVLDLFQRNCTILHRRNTFLLQDTLPPRELLQSLYEAIRFFKGPPWHCRLPGAHGGGIGCMFRHL